MQAQVGFERTNMFQSFIRPKQNKEYTGSTMVPSRLFVDQAYTDQHSLLFLKQISTCIMVNVILRIIFDTCTSTKSILN